MAKLGDWPDQGLERVRECPICSSKERSQIYEGLEDRIFQCAPGKWQLHKCSACGSAYLDPRPNKSTIGMAYDTYYTHDARKKTRFERAKRTEKVRIALENGYLNAKYGVRLLPSLVIGQFVLPRMPNRYKRVRRFTRDLPAGSVGRSVLDFGSGSGEFLELAKSLGWEGYGLDLDRKAVETARRRGVSCQVGGVQELEQLDKSFDYITLSHVIEHVHNPLDLLRACRATLNTEGVLWIETPNIDSLGHQRFGSNWRGLEPPRHLILFNPSSLNQILIEAGFSDIEFIESVFPLEVFVASEALVAGEDPLAPSDQCVRRAAQLAAELQSMRDDQEFLTVRAKGDRF